MTCAAHTSSLSGCDSSDCLVCHYCFAAGTDDPCGRKHTSTALKRQRSIPSGQTSPTSKVPASDPTAFASAVQTCLDELSDSVVVRPGLSGSGWRWKPEYAGRQQPAPASLLSAHVYNTYQPPLKGRWDIVCSLDFTKDGGLLAAGVVSKQVRIYNVRELLDGWTSSGDQAEGAEEPAIVHRLSSKVSAVCWSAFENGAATIGDYDGVLTHMDMCSGHIIAELEAHDGRRICSVAYSSRNHYLCGSASEDRSAKIWAGRNLSENVAKISPTSNASVCSVDFSQNSDQELALACSDTNVYLYDLRQLNEPLRTLRGHTRPASYVKYMGDNKLLSSSIDGTVALWDLQTSQATNEPQVVFHGHKNEKNFVGLAAHSACSVVATGSETSQVYAYYPSWSDPLAVYDTCTVEGQNAACVNSVAWHPSTGESLPLLLAAGNSFGEVNLLFLTEPPRPAAVCTDSHSSKDV